MRVPGWIDRDDREPTLTPAFVVLPDGNKLPVTITNMSTDGCQVQCDQLLPIGETVELEADDRRVAAHVRWSLPGSAGLRLIGRTKEE